MPLSLQEKFRREGLGKGDEQSLRNEIINARDPNSLHSYLYIYGRSFGENEQVLRICDRYISFPQPGLTATCMRVVIDYWNKVSNYLSVLNHYLDIDLLDEWYDEVIFTVSFINRNRQIDFPPRMIKRFAEVAAHPQIASLDIL